MTASNIFIVSLRKLRPNAIILRINSIAKITVKISLAIFKIFSSAVLIGYLSKERVIVFNIMIAVRKERKYLKFIKIITCFQ
jgi:hypothetical protein